MGPPHLRLLRLELFDSSLYCSFTNISKFFGKVRVVSITCSTETPPKFRMCNWICRRWMTLSKMTMSTPKKWSFTKSIAGLALCLMVIQKELTWTSCLRNHSNGVLKIHRLGTSPSEWDPQTRSKSSARSLEQRLVAQKWGWHLSRSSTANQIGCLACPRSRHMRKGEWDSDSSVFSAGHSEIETSETDWNSFKFQTRSTKTVPRLSKPSTFAHASNLQCFQRWLAQLSSKLMGPGNDH